jgi:ATP-dependent Clp protease ATP-binding subunit ClpX
MGESIYYNLKDLKDLYGLSNDAIHRLVLEGKLTECRDDRKTVFNKAEVLQLYPSDFLNPEEEKRLLWEIRKGNPMSAKKRDQFIRMHYTLIRTLVRQYTGQGVPHDKLASEALEELIRCVNYKTPSGENRFGFAVLNSVRKALDGLIAYEQKQTAKKPGPQSPRKTPARPPAARSQKPGTCDVPAALEKLKSVKDFTPRQLYQQLEDAGYVGQEQARRKLCLMAYRHIRRLKDHYLNKIPLLQLPPKSNVLMMGPTGCGKTHLTELLFGKIIGVPVATVDITGFTEAGYVGRNVSEILYEIEKAASGNTAWAKMGIVVIDEFDKIAASDSAARFSGGGTNKDVSGFGVQRQLLKMIEGGRHAVSSGGPYGMNPDKLMDTDHISFVACGAFSGIKALVPKQQAPTFGFNTSGKSKEDSLIAYQLDSGESVSVEVLSRYGLMPELVGRFNSITTLSPLDAKTLSAILLRNVMPAFEQEFSREGLDLQIPGSVVDGIVKKAVSRKTGARGLAIELTEYIEQKAFESFGTGNGAIEQLVASVEKCKDREIASENELDPDEIPF